MTDQQIIEALEERRREWMGRVHALNAANGAGHLRNEWGALYAWLYLHLPVPHGWTVNNDPLCRENRRG